LLEREHNLDLVDKKYYERFVRPEIGSKSQGGAPVFFYVVLIALAGAAVALYEVPKLYRQQMWREIAAFGIFLLVGMALSVALTLGLHVPNPTQLIEAVFAPFVKITSLR